MPDHEHERRGGQRWWRRGARRRWRRRWGRYRRVAWTEVWRSRVYCPGGRRESAPRRSERVWWNTNSSLEPARLRRLSEPRLWSGPTATSPLPPIPAAELTVKGGLILRLALDDEWNSLLLLRRRLLCGMGQVIGSDDFNLKPQNWI